MPIRSLLWFGVFLGAACASSTPALSVPEGMAESLPRESRMLLRDAAQEVVIAQADYEDALADIDQRERDLAQVRRADDSGGPRNLRDADIEVARARLAVAEAAAEIADERRVLARSRRELTHAEVMLRHELVSGATARVEAKRNQVKKAQSLVDEAVTRERKRRELLDQTASRRDQLLDRHLSETTQRPGVPWID